MLMFVPCLLLVMLSSAFSAPLAYSIQSGSTTTVVAESSQVSSTLDSPSIDVVSTRSPGDDSSRDPRVLNLPPMFKYMEEQLKHKQKDLEEGDEYEASIAPSPSTLPTSISTTSPTTTSTTTELLTTKIPIEESSTVYESVSTTSTTSTSGEEVTTTTPAFAIHPRFKYMEAQMDIEKDLEQLLSADEATTSPTDAPSSNTALPAVHAQTSEDLDTSAKYPTLLFGGFLPGPTGFFRKTKKLSNKEKKRKLKEMDADYAPILDDIKEEFGQVVQEEKERHSAELLKLRQNIQDLKTEIATNKLEKKRPYWLPFWGSW